MVLTNIFTFHWASRNSQAEQFPAEYAEVERLDIQWKRFWWNTPYSPANRSDADELWDVMLPSHGLISVDRKWAEQKHWPVSGYLPSDKSKGVYLLEAYHQLHCLRIIRKTFWESIDRQPLTYHPGAHLDHCFDTLRQSVLCNADNTPLYSFGDNTAGDGQLHKCKDWDGLRDFATRHTACYRDSVEHIPLQDHFGYCDDGRDGLLELRN